MKTIKYNPSEIEVDMVNALATMAESLVDKINMKLNGITVRDKDDNTSLKLQITDKDGDPHEVVMTIIQKPDPL